MFRNYLTTALRDLSRNPVQAFISVGGLAIGLAAMLVIGLMEFGFLTYDSFIQDHGRVYWAILQSHDSHGDQKVPVVPHELAAYLRQFPEVEAVARASGSIAKGGGTMAVRQGKVTSQERMDWADPEFFRVYRAPALYGDLDVALNRPDSAVLNLSTARKYFGQDNVVGRTLEIDRTHTVVVRAVIADQPGNAMFRAGLFMSSLSPYSPMSKDRDKPGMSRTKGFSPDMFTLVLLRPGASVESLNQRASAVVAPFAVPPFHVEVRFMPLSDVFRTLVANADARLLVLAMVAAVILTLSCINFVNLSIARAAQRSMEVAIRKTAGASRAALVVQFLGESVLQALLAFVIASAVVEWTGPALEAFADADLPNYWVDPGLLAGVLGGTVLTGIAAGLHPAFVLSGFQPSVVVKGWVTNSLKRGWLRAALVAFQFAAMAVFLIAAGVLFQQNNYLRTDPQRASVANTLLVAAPKCETALEGEIAMLPGVRGVTCSSSAVLDDGPASVGAKRKDGRIIQVQYAPVGLNFFEFYGWKSVAGRLFRRGDEPTDRLMNVVIDETAVRQLGFGTPEGAIGQSVDFENMHRTVIGVVKNFYIFEPTQSQPPPMIYSLTLPDGPFSTAIHVRIEPGRTAETQAAIEELWRKSGAQGAVFEIFLDQLVQLTELAPLRFGQIFVFFAGVAMVLACLGLFGISLLTAQRRIKEIGVRKAMGATGRDIVRLLLWQFAKPVLWANVIAWPVAFYAMNQWLSGFSYHVRLDWRIFAGATLITLAVALLTVAVQSIAAALAVPARALRYE